MSPMYLSMAGVDDGVDVQNLVDLAERDPRIEWSVLYLQAKSGMPRYPDRSWREEFLSALPKTDFNTALHLCDNDVYFALLDNEFHPIFKEIDRYGRIQVNINARRQDFPTDAVEEVYQTLYGMGHTLVLQCNDRTRPAIESFLKTPTVSDRVHVLLDASCGTGKCPSSWEEGWDIPTGYAGGISPDNFRTVLADVQKVAGENFWIDLESGVRVDNRFSMNKASQMVGILQEMCPLETSVEYEQ